jgi:phosphoribosylaminoimidazolecarboxamide formyltransferase/IMP cyclohydrolase
MTIRRALISVYDKTGIVDFARELGKFEIEMIATNGTLKILKKGGIRFIKHVSDVTEFPEILGGRVKTGHPKLIGGILALRDEKEHLNELERLGIKTIDMVVCNLHPFDPPINRGVELNSALENIDIGGPNLIRAAAKNFENVVVIVKPDRYGHVLQELKKKGDISVETRAILAIEAFKETARYDSIIYRFLEKRSLANARANE